MALLFDSEQGVPRTAPRRRHSIFTSSSIRIYFSIQHPAIRRAWSAS
jgi:hypothetical protein